MVFLVESNINLFVEFANCNLSRKFVELVLIFINHVEEPELSQIVPQNFGWISLYSHLSFTAVYSFKSEEYWSVDFVITP